MKFGGIVLQVSTGGVGFHNFKMAAMTYFHAESAARAQSGRRLYSSIRQFLIYSTLALVGSLRSKLPLYVRAPIN